MKEGINPELTNKEVLTRIIGGTPNVLYLMSGGIAKSRSFDFKSTSMKDPDYKDGYKFGYLGGILRVHALAHLYKHFPQTEVVTSSKIDNISHAAIQKRELKNIWNKMGIPHPEKIFKEEISNSTQTEIAEAVRLSVNNKWKGIILLVTNDYHVPRVNTMLKYLPDLKTQSRDESFKDTWSKFNDASLVVIAAEEILRLENPKWDNMLNKAFDKEPLKSARKLREESEANGINAIINNSYNTNTVRL